jgi:hypothetical protein
VLRICGAGPLTRGGRPRRPGARLRLQVNFNSTPPPPAGTITQPTTYRHAMPTNAIMSATLLAFAATTVPGQSPNSTPAFDVASIKPSQPGDRGRGIVINPGGKLDARVSTLKALIEFAYNVRLHQVTGGPTWLDADTFDIAAKADGRTHPDQLRLMLQTLLADRFKLKVHRETKELPVFALVAVKNGPKLRPVEAGNGPLLTGSRGQVTCERVSMPVFGRFLSQRVGCTVLDRTGRISIPPMTSP